MKKNKVTIQDIASSLDLSRNTVSKALNGNLTVGEKTRELVIRKAIDMGYKKFAMNQGSSKGIGNNVSVGENKMISLFTHESYLGVSYWDSVIKGLESATKNEGYNLMLNFVDNIEEENLILPKNFSPLRLSGIVTVGVFKKEYYRKVSSVGIPTVFVDTATEFDDFNLIADTIMINNESAVHRLTSHLIELGHREIGFIGDMWACRSLYERWIGYKRAMEESGLKINKDFCLTEPTEFHIYYKENILEWMQKMKNLPTAIVCSNDYNATELIRALKERKMNVPDDMSITGFDDLAEAKLITSSLTTVRINNVKLGMRAGYEILLRIKNNDLPKELIRITTEIIYRDSTRKLCKSTR